MASQSPGSGNSFACGQCSKVFNRRENLSRHVKNHANSRSHQCEICCKAFTRSDLLKRHLRLHDKDSSSTATGQATSNKRHKGNDAGEMHDTLGDLVNFAETANYVPTASEVNVQSHSLQSGSSSHTGPSPNDGHFNFNDAEHAVDLWSEDGLFDLPFLQQWNPDFPPSWDDYLAFEFECWRNDHFADSGNRGQIPDLHAEDSGQASAAISRAPSPPNEASHEDQTPFAWSPSSKRIAEPSEVKLDSQDPLLKDINPHFELNEFSYQTLRSSVTRGLRIDELLILAPIHSFPARSVVNAFTSRFAKCFLCQAPVIHVPTLDINDDLPDSLLAIMISIGATYCRRKNARRFAIVLQDWARCRMQLSIEADNTLLRSPMTLYAAALICYAGIWCGNKRAYELAEAMRGSVVTWLRRLVGNGDQEPSHEVTEYTDISEAWRAWAREDSQKRLQWMVYALDYQYASLTSMPASIYVFS